MSKAARSESGRRKGTRGGLVWPYARRPTVTIDNASRPQTGEPHPRSSLALAAQGGVTAETGVE